MKKSFQKSLIAASVGAVMFAAVGTASANSLLFPYFTTVAGAQSVLSLSNTGTAPATQALHYVYNYGPTCVHFDATGSLTANDILSHSIASTAAGGFGRVVATDTSVPVFFPLANQTGFLIVSSKTLPAIDALRGSMAIIDTNTGLVVSYPGIDNAQPTQGAAGANGEGDYSAITDVNFPLTALPAGIVSTSWFTIVVGNMGPVITTGANWLGGGNINNNGGAGGLGTIWNNDEVPFSGTQTKPIVCQATILPTDLATAAQIAAVGTNGGLVKATFVPTSVAPSVATGLIMAKIQTVLPAVGAPFAGKSFLHREQAGL